MQPKSSAPSSAATITSRPVFRPPSTQGAHESHAALRHLALRLDQPRLPWEPAFFMDETATHAAPVGAGDVHDVGSSFATPNATPPTPSSATSFTEIAAPGFTVSGRR